MGTTTTYEEFEPATQVKEEDPENTILLLHLPGFVKEQVRITYVESNQSIKVEGKRAVSGKWVGFNKVFQVPPNCSKPDKIHARFQNGILTITMPMPNQPPAPAPVPTSASIKQISPNKKLLRLPEEEEEDHVNNQKKKKIDDDRVKAAGHLLNNQDKILVLQQNPAAEKEKGSLLRRLNNDDDDQEAAAAAKRDVGVVAAALGRRRRRLNNETTLLLNVGVALVVIVALGAFATYKIRSKSNH